MVRWMVFVGLGLAAGCNPEEPCEKYVDYMCECHADDEDFDCGELQSTYQNADSEIQDECALDLSDQEDEDDAAGLDCSTTGT